MYILVFSRYRVASHDLVMYCYLELGFWCTTFIDAGMHLQTIFLVFPEKMKVLFDLSSLQGYERFVLVMM